MPLRPATWKAVPGWKAALTGTLLLAAGSAHAAPPLTVAQQALYALTLQSARGDVTGASGSMSYEVQDACDGWATRQRLDMTISNRDGQDIEMVSDYATWESKDGLHMRFRMRQTTDGAVGSDLAGEATLQPDGGPGEAKFSTPPNVTKGLPKGTLFPTAHTEAIIAAAEAGKKFLAIPLFDGTSGEGAQDSSIAITGWTQPKPSKWPGLTPLPSGTVHVAFFNPGPDGQTPDYEVGMRYWLNGVADDLNMDFGDFVMDGKLSKLDLPPSHC